MREVADAGETRIAATRKNARAALDAVGEELKRSSFGQLAELSRELARDRDGWARLRDIQVDGQTMTIYVLMKEWGLVCRRVSVEIIIASDNGNVDPEQVGFVYFERFQSGKLGGLLSPWAVILFVAILAIVIATNVMICLEAR